MESKACSKLLLSIKFSAFDVSIETQLDLMPLEGDERMAANLMTLLQQAQTA
jgi:hypothetical protein